MTRRRDLLIAGLCVGSAAAAYALTPRKHVSLVNEAKLDVLVPTAFGGWTSRDVSDPVALNTEDSLAAKLYNQLIIRAYANPETAQEIVMLLAYGAVQTDDLQLHRPEVCYPAFGYDILRNDVLHVPLPGGASIPARRLTALKPPVRENIVYWSRIGETLPLTGEEQRKDKLAAAFRGEIPDGVLCRFSCATGAPTAEILGFIQGLLAAMPANSRQMLIGTARAAAMRAA